MFSPVIAATATDYVQNRVADPSTMDDYMQQLLSMENGSRYAGRIWTDKSVFAFDAKGENSIPLDMKTDGYNGSVGFNADFAHVFSALASSQVINEWPPSPIDLVIVFDMSASMGQDTRYGLDTGTSDFTTHNTSGDSQTWPDAGVLMSDRINNSRIQLTLNAINNTIDKLMQQNPENRVAVCCYGANAVVLLPLAHYARADGKPYLTVGGMETLYHPGDLVWRDEGESGWYWINNRDTAYTVEAHALKNENVEPYTMEQLSNLANYVEYDKIISNNVKNTGVKAFPGVEDPAQINNASTTIKDNSKKINQQSGEYGARSANLIQAVADTKELEANDYVGYFTNTQGGIYLAYKQLADSAATTYTDRLSDGKDNTVARIPAAIIMSDGGANFAFNNMGGTVDDWNKRYGAKKKDSVDNPTDITSYYLTDDSYNAEEDSVDYTIREEDYKHRLGGNETENPGNIGDEWYHVYLPGDDTLAPGDAGVTTDDGKWDGLHTLYNLGADYYQDGTLQTPPVWDRPGVLYANDADWQGTPATVLEVLLTASYMKQVAMKHYEAGWEAGKASPDSRSTLSTYTMNVDTKDLPQWARWRLFPTLDPKNYPPEGLLDKVDADPARFANRYGSENYSDGDLTQGNLDGSYYGSTIRQLVFGAIRREWNALKDNHVTNSYEPLAGGASAGSSVAAKLDMTASPYAYNGITVSADEILDHIAYNDEFTDVTSGELDTTFERILSEITGNIFVPVSGSNDAGVDDSITYQDPLGDYMEIKNQAIDANTHLGEGTYDMSLLLFGKMHGLVRAGVYDWKWNDDYMTAHPKAGDKGETAFPMGWYRGNPENPETPTELCGNESGTYPKGYDSAEQAWADGWVYRFNFSTLLQFVPITGVSSSDVHPSNLPDQVKNTVYTCYRFAGSKEDRNALHRNPIFGDVPEDLKKTWEAHGSNYPVGNEDYADVPGVYRLSDIRVWVEDLGDYTDSTGVIVPNTGYDRSLYMNIPTAAVPTQLATITLGKDGVMSYETNLGKDHPSGGTMNGKSLTQDDYYAQSTPLRLFYSVGLEEDLILRDKDGNQTGVNFSKISPEYISAHTVEGQDYVWFISNYYSNTSYTEYVTDTATSRTRGDPTVSFSPSIENRYYVFQKPLPLYAHAYRNTDEGLKAVDRNDDQSWSKEDNQKGGNGSKKWESVDGVQQQPGSWVGGEYMGTYTSAETFKEAKNSLKDDKYIKDDKGVMYLYQDDGIVFLEQDLMDHVTSEADGGGYTDGSVSFNSSDYFFLLVEYYLPDENTVGVDDKGNIIPGSFGGRMVQRAVARRGSEFGSGFASDDINNGDMLCWTDMNGKITLEFDYLSKTDTGDLTRGEPTFQKLTYNESELRTYLRDTCKISESIMVPDPDDPEKQISVLEQQVKYWKAVQANEKVQAALEEAENGDGELTQDEFNKYFTFAVSARPGGIRSGDMSNNRHAKEKNVTNTAQNYYVPTVSDNSATDNGVILNTYLGNNGYLEIANQMLHVTKMIETPEDLTLTEGQMNEEFNYQIYVQGVTGTHSAIRTQYNKYAKAWERELAYIDVLTDNSNLIVDNNSRRAVFVYEAQEGSSMVAKQVIANGEENGNPIYYYASEDGTLTIKKDGSVDETINAKVSSGADLYYLYLPSNGTGTDAQHTRRLYQNKEYEGTVDGYVGTYDENETEYNNMFKGNGTTTFVNPGDHEITGKDPGAESRDSYRDATQFDNRPAGTKTYWAQDAELIPVTEVQAVENASDEALPGGPSTFALESVSSGMWTHGGSCAEGHKKLQYYTFVIRKPNNETSETAFESPFMTRSQYMTVELEFGKNANTTDGGSNRSGSNLTADDLYDNIVPSADRPDLFLKVEKLGYHDVDNDYIAEHTAEFTLKHGEGLLLSGLDNRIGYRFTEKLTDEQLKSGYKIKEISHVQQRGSESIYRPGVQQIPIYSSDGATYSNVYPASIQGKETENGLTWAIDKNGKENSTVKPKLEPFAHTNATMWMYYATMDVNSSGNHHQKSGESSKEVEKNPQVWNGGVNSYTELQDNPYTVADNPSCEKCDEPIYEGDTLTGYLHYMYKNGVLVDPHYEGEASTYLRNMARYGVSPTVRFGVNGEKQEDTAKLATLPENDYYDYSGVYSVYGNTGWFEESANYVNTVEPEVLVITKKMVDMSGKEVAVPPDKEFTFTLKLTSPENGTITSSDTLHYWKGNISDLSKAPDRNSYDEINALKNTLQLNKVDGEEAYTATIKLKAKEAVVLYGLIAGTKYTVTETKDDKYPIVDSKDYTQTGTIEQKSAVVAPAESQNRADFINQLPSGILSVEKEIRDNDPDTEKEFGFTVTLTAEEGESLDKAELTMTKVTKAADGTETQESIADPGWKETKTDDRVTKLEVEFNLKHGEKVVINGIPLETTYTVDETNRNGYTLKDIETKSGNVSVHGKIASGKIEKAEAAMTFVNVPAVFLPEAGGMGILIFCIIGALLISCATAYIVLNRKKLFNKYRR